jgi:flagellar L-ring protein precursor FlgH
MKRGNTFLMMKYVSAVCVLLCFSVDYAHATSLWSGVTAQGSSLFVDRPTPQLKENDIVVIIVEEETSALSDADSDAKVDDSIDGSISNWFSIENAADLLNLLMLKSPDVKTKQNETANLPKWGVEIKNEFKGEAETTRNNTVSAMIAAKVIAVRPNGNVVLEGKRQIKINAETTILTVTGIARQEDVSDDNTVYSKLMTDLTVAIDGRGIVANANRRGIISHILNLIR